LLFSQKETVFADTVLLFVVFFISY